MFLVMPRHHSITLVELKRNVIILMAEIDVFKIHDSLRCAVPASLAFGKGSLQQLFLLPHSVGMYWCNSVLSAVSVLLHWLASQFWNNLTSL